MTDADAIARKYDHISIDPSSYGTLTLDGKGIDSQFQDFVFKNVAEIAQRSIEYHKNRTGKDPKRIKEGRAKLAEFSANYLKKIESSLSDEKKKEILALIEIIKTSEPEDTLILMSAHQPNLFAYSGILRKIALLKAVEIEIKKSGKGPKNVVCFYGFADHDFVHNKWVRSAEMAAPLKRDGMLRFNMNVERKELFMPSKNIEKPSAEKLETWHSQISSWICENSALALKYAKMHNMERSATFQEKAKKNLDEFWTCVVQAHGNASSLAEFSSFTLATVVNSVLDSPLIFANFSDCYTAFGKEYELLLENVKEYSDTIEKYEVVLKNRKIDSGLSSDISELLPIWIKCSCGSKYRVSTSASLKFYGKCVSCEKEITYTGDELRELLKAAPELFEPRSISMPIVLGMAIDMSCYIGGIGGLGYLMHSKEISRKLELPFPPTPFWYVKDEYIGIETLASAWETKRISNSYGLNNLEGMENVAAAAQQLYKELNARMENGEVPKSSISERERQLLAGIPASLSISSCAIDYAINIGIQETYKQWIDFLVSGGSLQDTIKLNSIISNPK